MLGLIRRSRSLPQRAIKFPGLLYSAPKLNYPADELYKKPVVILFGWLGASDRHLAKYVKLYNDKGYETISYIPPMRSVLNPSKIPLLNEQIHTELLKIMKSENLLRRPFLLHLFSNNGYIHWCYYQEYLQNQVQFDPENIFYKMQGTVVDSAPCKLSPEVMTRGFIGALFPKLTNHKHWLISPLFETFWTYYLKIPSIARAFERTNKLISKTILPFPQYYFYSSADTMLYSSDIEKHCKSIERKTRLPTFTMDFLTSQHVSHSKAHPTEYSRRVDAVLDTVEHQVEQQLRLIRKVGPRAISNLSRKRRIVSKRVPKMRVR